MTLTTVLLFLAGWVVAGVAACLILWRWVYYLERELGQANDRLLAAWKDGKVIPPREGALGQPVELEPLPPELQSFVAAWESIPSQMAEEAKIRRWLADGWKPDRIAKYLADPPPAA